MRRGHVFGAHQGKGTHLPGAAGHGAKAQAEQLVPIKASYQPQRQASGASKQKFPSSALRLAISPGSREHQEPLTHRARGLAVKGVSGQIDPQGTCMGIKNRETLRFL